MAQFSGKRKKFGTYGLAITIATLVTALTPGAASAHVERPSYWPNPKADCSISPCAGGAVPTARSLTSALQPSSNSTTRVVCHNDSLTRAHTAIINALHNGYYDRPTVHSFISNTQATALWRLNQALFHTCTFHEIQPAVNASHNNDRVVVMPGLYTEPTTRKVPDHSAQCAKYSVKSDGGDPGALSHDYQVHCPNDANLVAVIGRGLDTGAPPSPPLVNRHGIPDVGSCIRCNLQLEGSGVSADDVIVEAGNAAAGNGGPSAAGHAKDVALFVDRADGFVMQDMTFRHAREHDVYILETDGYLFNRFKTFYAGGYGVLTFVEDHGLIQNCDAAGNGDSGIYPGAGADSTDKRYLPFYPVFRYSQTVQYCDSHHNDGGFSGTDSHGTLVQYNNFYDNALGYTTDVFTAPGHPGFPQHGNVVRNNNFYSNNFNVYSPTSDVQPFVGSPVGTGLWLAGGNNNSVEGNYFWNNWRRGAMLFAVPDATVCGPPPVGSSTPVPGCNPLGISTSYRNVFHGNTMGVTPHGAVSPNGVDFWWDSFAGNTGNCWYGNHAAPGKTLNNSPASLPDCTGGTNPSSSIGLGDAANEVELVSCLAGFQVSGYPNGNSTICTWTATPSKPAVSSASPRFTSAQAPNPAMAQEYGEICSAGLAVRLCGGLPDFYTSVLGTLQDLSMTLQSPVLTATPQYTPGRLSQFTCDWWRKATPNQKLGMVQRIQQVAGAPINGSPGDQLLGYGASMSTNRAALLFEDRCSTAYAGPFALYKIYGAAAPFAASSN
ncbi:hypothetical protein Back2_14680 [Nocardioides baekrokdamisoli]|uniref:Right handed beta helix domain-containing protein n=1 Tax=Nocardioides baekrokdamisoli TaxID=1804624 RepID=A0A3G9IU72_9ACTN|nr:right-handed parallel beta-helix repeat-containing protein [Nocardioides baekrokdamisoli]BBH17181.1 hypothetical protein Back2_14680 [Nocardioides baekrokdamisoli]